MRFCVILYENTIQRNNKAGFEDSELQRVGTSLPLESFPLKINRMRSSGAKT